MWKCDPIQRNIPFSLLLESTPPQAPQPLVTSLSAFWCIIVLWPWVVRWCWDSQQSCNYKIIFLPFLYSKLKISYLIYPFFKLILHRFYVLKNWTLHYDPGPAWRRFHREVNNLQQLICQCALLTSDVCKTNLLSVISHRLSLSFWLTVNCVI